ncbi:unnamed protein product [Adineta steineri]|uniref:Cyclic nucleotide-binding domain-containing protein n=1 Tax=Adineta steineri TaxID=433720 RepID=A0A814R3J0_9BILA|nr:unnamed protein product [Adineta steineri]
MQEAHPGTIISIKTYHTLNLLYNTAKRGITQIRSRGVLDVDDCDLLEQSLQNMHIHLHIPSTMPPISPMIIIKKLSWLYSNQQLNSHQINTIEKILIKILPNENTKYFENESILHPQSFTWQDFLWHKNDTINGIYLLVNGIVEEWKLDPYDIDAYHSELRWKENNRTRRTTLTTPQNQNYRTISNKSIDEPLNMNRTDSDISSEDESIVSTKTVVSTNVSEKDLVPLNTNIVSYNDDSTLTTSVRIAFEEGFYMRWHHFLTNSIDNKFNNNSMIMNDSIDHIQSDENFEEYFDETFEKYRQIHPATSERIHRRYSLKSGDCIGLYDFLINNGEKYESTAKCLTNITVFCIAKEKLFEIFNTYSLWNVIWLEMSINLALHILPNISSFQYTHNKHPTTNFDLLNKRLIISGLLIYNEIICTSDDIIQLNEDLLLVAGSVRNQITKCIYEAPIFIKRSLTRQGLKLLEDRSSIKILIIPRISTTTTIENHIFTDSLLIQHILDNKTKQNSTDRSNDYEQTKFSKNLPTKSILNILSGLATII